MLLSSLTLENFRSYSKGHFDFSPHYNLIMGNNGTGKTNILESIYILSTGKSFRASKLGHVISWNQNFTSIQGSVSFELEIKNLEVQCLVDPANSSKSSQKRFFLNQVAKTRRDFLGLLKSVVFQPDDIRLVSGSPSRRREFMDSVFLQTSWRYAQASTQYHKALKHRNELLDLVREGKSQKSEMFYWDQSLIKNSQIIFDDRRQFINHVNQYLSSSPNSEVAKLSLKYQPSLLTQDKLDKNYWYELERGYTQSGPHLDDFSFQSQIFADEDKSLSSWGSRGQQRLAVLGLKLAEIDFIENQSHQRPVLLLDDIFSELDSDHQKLVTDICHRYQTIITTSDSHTPENITSANIIQLA